MSSDLRVAGICERDLDLLLAEEMFASASFRDFLLDAVGFSQVDAHTLVAVRRGATHSTGESDLELEIARANGERIILLVENKVDAVLQDRQAERYLERATSYIAAGRCATARTLVIAPGRYFGDSDDDVGFDASLTYEDVAGWFADADVEPERRAYKVALLGAAIEKAVLGYQRVADGGMTALWGRYAQVVAEHAPELNMPGSEGRPSGSHFVYFKPDSLPRPLQLVHKFAYGHVDVQFPRWGKAIGRLREQIGPTAPSGCMVARAGKSAVLRRNVRKVSVVDADQSQIAGMREGVLAAKEMLEWTRVHSELLRELRDGPA